MIILPNKPLMWFTDGERTSKSIWEFTEGRKISRHALHDLLMFHYFPWGQTLVEGVYITYPYDCNQLCRMFSAAMHWNELDLDQIDCLLAKNLEAVPDDETVYVGMSGGPDSSLIAAKLISLNKSIKGFTIIISGVDESEDAQKVADELGIELDVITIDNHEILKELPGIIQQLGLPYDRGSLIPSYFIFKNYPSKIFVLGDGAEPIFEPSYRSRLRAALGREDYAHKLESITIKELHGLTGEWICIDSPFIFRNNLSYIALFDIISETPFYYLHKLNQLVKDETVYLPYLDPDLYIVSLGMKELQVFYPYRKHLYSLIERYMDSAKVKQVKMALKIKVLPEIIHRYMDTSLLRRIGINAQQAQDEWTRYILSLICIWLKHFEQHGGILELR